LNDNRFRNARTPKSVTTEFQAEVTAAKSGFNGITDECGTVNVTNTTP